MLTTELMAEPATNFDDATQTRMVFDTNCVLCSGAVHFILRHERDNQIQFVNAWSQSGAQIAGQYGLTPADLDKTVLVVSNLEGLVRSNAVLELLKHLNVPWRWGRIFKIIPRPIRDFFYSAIAKRRYRIFGYRDNCFVPAPDMHGRFVDR